MEQDFHQNNSYNLFKTVKDLEGAPKKTIHTIIDKQGKKQTNINKVLKCWEEHFQQHLNKEFPHHQSTIDEISVSNQPDIPLEPISKEEIQGSIHAMKNRKTPGADSYLLKFLKQVEIK